MNFTGNQAIIGSAIYTNEVALCSWYSYSPPHFKATELPWPFMSFGYVLLYIIHMCICMYDLVHSL